MRTFNRVSGEYRRHFEQALRDAERELEFEETRKSVEAAFEKPPASTEATVQPNDQGDRSTRKSGEHPLVHAASGSKHNITAKD